MLPAILSRLPSIAACILLAGPLCCHVSIAADVSREAFGALTDGTRIEVATLSNRAGVRVRVMTFGAAVQSLVTPDRHGRGGDVVLGFDSVQEYEKHPGYFGATVGRTRWI